MVDLSELKKFLHQSFSDIVHFRMTLEAVGASFFLVIVTLPMVNKVSKAATLLYLLFFARMVYRQRDFFLPSVHKVFLIFLSVLIFISALFNTISLEHFKRAMYLAVKFHHVVCPKLQKLCA